MLRRWFPSAYVLAAGIAFFFLAGPIPLIITLVVAVAVSPRAFPRSVTDAEARRQQALDGRPIVYWRPGCPYCIRLRATLGRRGRNAHWVDIWQDPAGAATVRAIADGNETVPTVVLPDEALVNPDPRGLRARV